VQKYIKRTSESVKTILFFGLNVKDMPVII